MHPFDLSHLLQQATPVIVAVFLYGQVVAWLYAAVRVTYCKASGRPFPSNRVTMALDAVIELLPNAPGAINKLFVIGGLPPILLPLLPLPPRGAKPVTLRPVESAPEVESADLPDPPHDPEVQHPEAVEAASGEEP